jgi:hypothetical protein
MAGILAVGTAGKVMIGHHFLFDMKTPFAVNGSDQLIMLTGHLTVDMNPVAIDPAAGLATQRNATGTSNANPGPTSPWLLTAMP